MSVSNHLRSGTDTLTSVPTCLGLCFLLGVSFFAWQHVEPLGAAQSHRLSTAAASNSMALNISYASLFSRLREHRRIEGGHILFMCICGIYLHKKVFFPDKCTCIKVGCVNETQVDFFPCVCINIGKETQEWSETLVPPPVDTFWFPPVMVWWCQQTVAQSTGELFSGTRARPTSMMTSEKVEWIYFQWAMRSANIV